MMRKSALFRSHMCLMAGFFAVLVMIAGCRARPIGPVTCATPRCSDVLQNIETPDLCDDSCDDTSGLLSGPPMTISTFYQSDSLDLTIDQAVELALRSSDVLQRLGGTVLSAPQGAQTLYDVAINETNPQGSVEAALSAFDAQVASSAFANHNERKFNNIFFGGGAPTLTTNSGTIRNELFKQTAGGTRFAIRNLTDYNRNDSPFNRFASTWDTVNQMEIRQPLLRGSGVTVNRIAGPNAVPGVYNGVMIARIRSDISMADFEASVQNLVRDVERNYWELYFAYRDLDTKIAARESARETWENRQLRFEKGVGRPDEEAQARQQFFSFQNQAQNALTGTTAGSLGVMGAERNLRRLLGMPVSDGKIIRPISDPAVAPVVFDWETMQHQAIERRVELRRQKWTIKQRELELLAAKQLNMWRFDAVGLYGFRGFGDDFIGNGGVPEGSAVSDLFTGKLDDWQMGFELGGPIGNRVGHLAVRNAELRVTREKKLYREQQRQILHELGANYTEVDRAMAAIRTSYNAQVAAREELEPKKLRVDEGKDQVFFLLDAQQRMAIAESGFYRAIVDYNVALMNMTQTTGGLLDRYNIYLEEGDWDEGLQLISQRKANRVVEKGSNEGQRDMTPVSNGPFTQNVDVPATSVFPPPPKN